MLPPHRLFKAQFLVSSEALRLTSLNFLCNYPASMIVASLLFQPMPLFVPALQLGISFHLYSVQASCYRCCFMHWFPFYYFLCVAACLVLQSFLVFLLRLLGSIASVFLSVLSSLTGILSPCPGCLFLLFVGFACLFLVSYDCLLISVSCTCAALWPTVTVTHFLLPFLS